MRAVGKTRSMPYRGRFRGEEELVANRRQVDSRCHSVRKRSHLRGQCVGLDLRNDLVECGRYRSVTVPGGCET